MSWLVTLCRPFFKTPQQGCQTTVYLATSEDVQGVSGKYFSNCAEAWLYGPVQNENTHKKIWELSKELAGLKEDDPKIWWQMRCTQDFCIPQKWTFLCGFLNILFRKSCFAEFRGCQFVRFSLIYKIKFSRTLCFMKIHYETILFFS